LRLLDAPCGNKIPKLRLADYYSDGLLAGRTFQVCASAPHGLVASIVVVSRTPLSSAGPLRVVMMVIVFFSMPISPSATVAEGDAAQVRQVYPLIDFTVEIEGVSSDDVEDVQEEEVTRAAAAECCDDDK
jgi:hypothetical protein